MSSTSEEFIQIAKSSSETPPNQWILPWEHCVPSEQQAELRISIEALFLGNARVRLGEVSTGLALEHVTMTAVSTEADKDAT